MKLIECIGQLVRCPLCGTEAKVKGSRPTGKMLAPSHVAGMPPQYIWPAFNPNWAIVDCSRCGKTQYQATREVQLIPPSQSPVQSEPHVSEKVVKHGR